MPLSHGACAYFIINLWKPSSKANSTSEKLFCDEVNIFEQWVLEKRARWRSCKRYRIGFSHSVCSSASTTLLLLHVLELPLGLPLSLFNSIAEICRQFFYLYFLSHSSMGHHSKEIVHSIGQTRYQLKRTYKSHEISNVQIWQYRPGYRFNDTHNFQFPQNCIINSKWTRRCIEKKNEWRREKKKRKYDWHSFEIDVYIQIDAQ